MFAFCPKRYVYPDEKVHKTLVCGMASSERRGKMNIATRLESDRLVITVNEAAQLSPMDVNGLRLVYSHLTASPTKYGQSLD